MDRGTWQTAVPGVAQELDTTYWPNNNNREGAPRVLSWLGGKLEFVKTSDCVKDNVHVTFKDLSLIKQKEIIKLLPDGDKKE